MNTHLGMEILPPGRTSKCRIAISNSGFEAKLPGGGACTTVSGEVNPCMATADQGLNSSD